MRGLQGAAVLRWAGAPSIGHHEQVLLRRGPLEGPRRGAAALVRVPCRCAGAFAHDRRPRIGRPCRAVVAAVGGAVALTRTAAVVGRRRRALGRARRPRGSRQMASHHQQDHGHSEELRRRHPIVPMVNNTTFALRTGAPGVAPGRGSRSKEVERPENEQVPCRFSGIRHKSLFINCFSRS